MHPRLSKDFGDEVHAPCISFSLTERCQAIQLALAKHLNGKNVCQSAILAADTFEARAGLSEYEIGQLTLDALMTRPPSGTGDVQRRRVLENLFGDQISPWER